MKRTSGILLHPTSLPGEYGIGTLGKEAMEFIDFLAESKQKLWQILPLGTRSTVVTPRRSGGRRALVGALSAVAVQSAQKHAALTGDFESANAINLDYARPLLGLGEAALQRARHLQDPW